MTDDPMVRSAPPALPEIAAQLEQDPQQPDLWLQAGQAMMKMGETAQAEQAFRNVTLLAPHAREGWVELGRTVSALGRREDAVYAFERAVASEPDHVDSRVRLSACLISLGRLDDAETHVAHLLTVDPDGSGSRAVAARLAHRRGDLERAWQLVAGRAPDTYTVEAIASLALARKRPADALSLVRAGVEQTRGGIRSLFLKYEGDLWDALGEEERAFEAWQRSNQGRGLRFDPRSHRAAVEHLITRTKGPWTSRVHPESDLPVLIVGVPRSGTTLLEQALACHPEVAAGGELSTLRHLGLAVRTRGFSDWADALGQLPAEDWERTGQGYLTRLRSIGSTASRVTDKMPNNLLQLGLLAQILPGTRVVLCTRSPVDTGFSCFRQVFGPGLPWATDVSWTACWIETCAQLWRAWAPLLPLRVHQVAYEDLVATPEPVLREVLGFLDLPWNDAVLRPESNERAVATASAFEVVKPIHRGSVGRASRYRRFLGPLVALEDSLRW